MAQILKNGKQPPWVGMEFDCSICGEEFKLDLSDERLVKSVGHEKFCLVIEVRSRCPNCRAVCAKARAVTEYEVEK